MGVRGGRERTTEQLEGILTILRGPETGDGSYGGSSGFQWQTRRSLRTRKSGVTGVESVTTLYAGRRYCSFYKWREVEVRVERVRVDCRRLNIPIF
jgi:hypothetical protein